MVLLEAANEVYDRKLDDNEQAEQVDEKRKHPPELSGCSERQRESERERERD